MEKTIFLLLLVVVGCAELCGLICLPFWPKKSRSDIVCRPLWMCLIYMAAAALSLTLGYLAVTGAKLYYVGRLFAWLLPIPAPYFAARIVMCCGWRLRYDQAGFTVRSACFLRRTYRYTDITAADGRWHDGPRLYLGTRRVKIPWGASDRAQDFLTILRKDYRCRHDGAAIPLRRGTGLFRGNVDEPVRPVFMACFIGLLCLLWGIVFTDYELNRYTPHALQYETVTFDHYSIDGRCLDLYVQGKRRPLRVIDPDTALFDPEAFLAACDRGEAFAVAYRNEHISRNASPSYPLYNIISADGQTVYMTIEHLRERALPQRPSRIALYFTPFAIWLVFCSFGILVARHPAVLGGKPFRWLFVDEPKIVHRRPRRKIRR